ncbi:response regulator [Microvirga sp. BT689]|uniref:response regulator n=1 Tax=Microvirga arvi TaxID=2778731 RepID=UPI001951E82E|nr:response regulator [Microvirga arvi]MBM6580851.1 response regulator [Microvirga arvi]
MSNSSCQPPITVLLVDDEVIVRVPTAQLLEHKGGLQVIEASRADEALMCLNKRPEIQGLITEVRIPGALNGFALARVVSERWPHIAVVITSHQQEPESGEIPDGSVYLQKPYRSERLINTIKPLISRSKASSI